MLFTKEYTKLAKDEFTTVRKNTKFYTIGRTYKVTSPEQIFRVVVTKRELIHKADITDRMAFEDADCTAAELRRILEKWYGENFDDFVLLTVRKVYNNEK